jgi:anti-anti-sigma factor
MDSPADSHSLYPYDGETLLLSGEIDLLTAPILRSRLHQAASGAGDLVVDLSAVTFMDCAGLEPLLEARTYLRGRISLRGLPWSIVQILRVTGLLTTFTILDALESGGGAEQDRRHDEAVVHRLRRDAGSRDHVL